MSKQILLQLLLVAAATIHQHVVSSADGGAALRESYYCQSKCVCTDATLDCTGSLDYTQPSELNLWTDVKTNVSYTLTWANLSHNNIGNLSKDFPSSNVQVLDLSFNMMRSISDSVFKNLQAMTELFLNDNELENLTPEVFRGVYMDSSFLPLRSLVKLHLDNNKFHTLNQGLFAHIDHIREVTLRGNPLKIIDQQTVTALTTLSYLQVLDLSNTQLQELPERFLHTPKYLMSLNLSENALAAVPAALSEAQSLETLYLDNNPIVNLSDANIFPTIVTLKYLYMRRMPVLHLIGPRALGGLSYNLTELYLSDNPILSDIDDLALARKDFETDVWPSLKKLYIQNCQLTHITAELFPKWRDLQDMDIRNNPWTCECENQWIVEELILDYAKLHPAEAKTIQCAAPIEMKNMTLYNLAERKYEMRCLDLYGHRPEKDGSILVATLVILLVGIPVVLFLAYAYQRRWFVCFEDGPAGFSRHFYRRSRDDDF